MAEQYAALYYLVVSPVAWWAFGLAVLLLIIALFVKGLRRDDTRGLVKCPACAEFVKPEARVCKHCRTDLGAERQRLTRRR